MQKSPKKEESANIEIRKTIKRLAKAKKFECVSLELAQHIIAFGRHKVQKNSAIFLISMWEFCIEIIDRLVIISTSCAYQ